MKKNKNKKAFCVDPDSPLPLYEQIKREIKLNIRFGILQPDEKLLPIREYARILKVNQNTIVKVYYQLDNEGFLYSKPGQGYFVRNVIKEDSPEDRKLFRSLTDEYLVKVTDLGFSIDLILEHLNARKKK